MVIAKIRASLHCEVATLYNPFFTTRFLHFIYYSYTGYYVCIWPHIHNAHVHTHTHTCTDLKQNLKFPSTA